MCTVTFVPANGKIYITSNRDENSKRPIALAPQTHNINGHIIAYPIDPLSKGTWIAVRKDKTALVLLNGAFEKHHRQPLYRKSRGQVFLDIASSANIITAFTQSDLHNIEPFTLITWQYDTLHQLIWDGQQKHIHAKEANIAHIWSSCTLYNAPTIAYRQTWLRQWINCRENVQSEDIIDFHLYKGNDGNEDKNIRINRNAEMLTVSTACIEIGNTGVITFSYHDLVKLKNYALTL